MLIIFVIGNIGSGKSSFAKILCDRLNQSKLSAAVIDLDKLSKELCSTSKIKAKISNSFKDVKSSVELSNIVFADKERLCELQNIIYPDLLDLMTERFESFRASNIDKLIVEESAFSGAKDKFAQFADKIICVSAPENLRLARCLKKGMTENDFLQRNKMQLEKKVLETNADFVVNNDGDVNNLKEKIEDLIRLL